MTSTIVKRSQFKTFLNTGTLVSPVWSLIGDGVASAEINYAPKTSSEIYIHEDSGSTIVEAYQPTMPVEAVAKNGDAVFEFLDNLRKTRAVADAATSEICNVWLYETGGPTAYPAEKQACSIQIDKFGGAGGSPAKIGYTINLNGDPVRGTFNATTPAFTAS